MRFLILVLLLLPAAVARAQDQLTIGIRPSKEQIEAAKKAVEAGKVAGQFLNITQATTVRQIDVGQYIQFELGSTGQLWLWDGSPVDAKKDYPLQRYDIAANAGFVIAHTDSAKGTAELVPFKPNPKPWGILFGRKPGRVVITVIVSGEGGSEPVIVNTLDVTVGTPTPPEPPPSPTPIKDKGLRVLMVYESSDGKIPYQQSLVLNSQIITDYMNTHCEKVNNHPEWRKFDKDTDVSRESSIWQEAMKRPRTTLPWIIVSNGKDGYEGPLPASVEETLKLLKKYGGD